MAKQIYGCYTGGGSLAKMKTLHQIHARKREARAADAAPESASESVTETAAPESAPAQAGPRVHLRKSAE